jgi:hypothetical protein
MGFGSQIDLILVSLVAEEEHLAAVSDQNQRIVGKRHRKLLGLGAQENALLAASVAATCRSFRHAGLEPAPAFSA